jgi:hypothetical protein
VLSEKSFPINCPYVFIGKPQLTLRIILLGYDPPTPLMYPITGEKTNMISTKPKNYLESTNIYITKY